MRHMARAVELAAEAAASGEAPIGAVIVDPDTDEVIAEGANCPIAQHDPTSHAEIVALRKAATRLGNYRLTGLSMYVSLEPCAMCAGAISHARIGRLVVGALDEKGGAVINGPRFFDSPSCHWSPEVECGLMASEASELLKSFFKERRKRT